MPFWTYMLHCADRTFYVGHTDDLERRVGEHTLGLIRGYTQMRRPVKLVWSQEFGDRGEAREAERQLKGWGRAKKLALIRGDWKLIAFLAKGKGRASTSSAKPAGGTSSAKPAGGTSSAKPAGGTSSAKPAGGTSSAKPAGGTSSAKPAGGEISVLLHPHPDHIPSEPFALEVRVRRGEGALHLRYRLTGPVDSLAIPPPEAGCRAVELWRHTCFEAFISTGAGSYAEINLSPSRNWAAYGFDGYRSGMHDLPIEPLTIKVRRERFALDLVASIKLTRGADPERLNLAAVIEERSGAKSYWALRHPPGDPDFHHPACFTLELPPAASA